MAMTLITNSATTDSTDLSSIVFDSGIDSTYKLYIFKFIDLNPATDGAFFQFQANAASQSGYNETITSTAFWSYHNEGDSSAAIQYMTGHDQAQGTGSQLMSDGVGNAADESIAGEMYLFNPSNTTYVKHFLIRTHGYSGTGSNSAFITGYFNITAAIDDVEFEFSTGNFDGTIKMYGVG